MVRKLCYPHPATLYIKHTIRNIFSLARSVECNYYNFELTSGKSIIPFCFNFVISLGEYPISFKISLVCSPTSGSAGKLVQTMLDKDGAGRGKTLESSRFRNVFRLWLWGYFSASSIVSTGATHASTWSNMLHHSDRVFPLNILLNNSLDSLKLVICGACSSVRPNPKIIA